MINKRALFCAGLFLSVWVVPVKAGECFEEQKEFVEKTMKTLALHRSTSPTLPGPVVAGHFIPEPSNLRKSAEAIGVPYLSDDEVRDKLIEYRKEHPTDPGSQHSNMYGFEKTLLTRNLESPIDTDLFKIYKLFDKMAKSNANNVVYTKEEQGNQPFTTLSFPRFSSYQYIFTDKQLELFCSTVHKQRFTFPQDKQKAQKLVNGGLTGDEVTKILKKIDDFLPNPGLIMKVKNTCLPRRVSSQGVPIYSTLEGAPGGRRNSFAPASPSMLPRVLEEHNMKKRNSQDYSATESTAEFLERYNKRRSSLASSNSCQGSPILQPSPSSPSLDVPMQLESSAS